MKLLVPFNEKQQDAALRAAGLYRFDKKIYARLVGKGYSFEIYNLLEFQLAKQKH
jgi:hypothetical protein